jgi:hypothetical protein
MSETSLLEQLKSHVGGLVRVRAQRADRAIALSQWNSKLCLLLAAGTTAAEVVEVKLLADGRIIRLPLIQNEIEFIGAEERER